MARFGIPASLCFSPASKVSFQNPLLLSYKLLNLLMLILFAILIGSVTQACGQAVTATGNTVNGETAKPSPGGHDYSHFLAEMVNPSSGSVSLTIKFPTPKGRGISLPYSTMYNSAGLYRLTETPLQLIVFRPNHERQDNMPEASWTESEYTPPPVQCPPDECHPLPFAQCNYATNFTFTDLAGTSHNLGIAVESPLASQNNQSYASTCGLGNTVPSANNGIGTSGGGVGDGNVSAIFSNQAISVSDVSNWNVCDTCDPQSTGLIGAFTVTDDSGITYFFDGICSFDSIDDVCKDMPYQIEDRNGNQITSPTLPSLLYNDTLGRPLAIGNANSLTIGGITYPSGSCAGSCPTTTTVSYTPPSQFTFSSGWGEVIDCAQNTPGSSMTVSGAQPAWGSVALPDGTQYTFYYGGFNPADPSLENPYGLLNEIIYPGGGWVKYTWKMSNADPLNTYTDLGTFTGQGETSHDLHPGCFTRYGKPVLASRTVSYDGVNVAQTQLFTYSTTWPADWGSSDPSGWSAKSTTVLTTDNIRGGQSFKTVYNYASGAQPGGTPPFVIGGVASEVPVESTTQYYDWNNGPLLRTIRKTWFDLFHLSEEDVTLDNGQTAKTTYAYTGGPCVNAGCITSSIFPIRLTTKSEYDYSGNLIRSTSTNYQIFGLSPYQTSVPPEPSSVIVSSPSGSVAETDYSYDESPGPASVSVMQHDANYSNSFTSRGNLTTKTQRCLTPSTTSGCSGDAVTKYAYDIAGQVLSVTDPCGGPTCIDMDGSGGHTTTYSYADQGAGAPGNSDAYATQIVYPTTNGIPHVEKFTYNYTFGDLTYSVDQNGKTTNYVYNDPLDRLTETDYPDGGKTTITYSGQSSITTSQLITSSPLLQKTTVATLDGMYHVTKTQITTDTCGDITDTMFDGESKVFKQSNPHCASEGINWTQNNYDALGRTASTLETDGSTQGASYTGATTTTNDEVGNQRVSVTDALGRLIEVDEPGAPGTPATPATGSFTISGNEQSAVTGPPVAGTGSVTFSGTLQSWQTQTAPATNSSGSVTINGSLQSKQVQTQTAASGSANISITGSSDNSTQVCPPHSSCMTEYNTGTVSLIVDGFTSEAPYSQNSTAQSVSAALANGFNTASSPVNASGGGGVVTVTAKAQGASTNYSFSSSETWETAICPNGSPCFGGSPFGVSPASGALSGGQNTVTSTISDSGTVTITINGQSIVYAYSGAQGSTSATIAQGLATDINNGSSYATASASGSTIFLQSRTTGASVNYSLSSSDTYDTTHFSAPSFTATNSGSTLTGGTNAQFTTNYDSGTATADVNAHSTIYSWSGSSTTPSSIASGLALAINQDASASVNATASGATVSLTARTAGAGTNYTLSAAATSSHSSFSSSISGTTLTGGAAAPVTFDTGTVTVTINGTPASVSYNSSSTPTSVASSLASAIAAALATTSGPGTGSTVNVTTAQAGVATNYPFAGTSSTSQPGTFSGPSFIVSVSGSNLTGGTDGSPYGGTFSLSTPARTYYSYDALDDLTNVTQENTAATPSSLWRVRSFAYDSLSQLATANNPESANITYTYDFNGNVASRVDARGIKTTYTYDNLNRLTKKAYTNDPANTFAPTYGYDGVAGFNGAPGFVNCPPTQTILNPIGRRTSMCDQAGTESWSYPLAVGTGWGTSDKRTTNGFSFTLPTQKNLDGSLASVTYPDTVTLAYTYDGAGRPTGATAVQVGINFVSNATYTGFGGLKTARYNTGMYINNTYNTRMQPLSMGASAPALSQSTILSLGYDFHLGNHDNGNVYQVANGKNDSRTQNFTYDALNRIATAYSDGTSGTTSWGEIYTIDPWGNLTNRNGIPGKANYEPLNAAPSTVKNQLSLSGTTYDASGNMMQSGYTYDAENRLKTAGGVTYTYDGDGNRTMKSNGAIYWGGGEGGALAETDLAGNIQQEYVFFNGKRMARVDETNDTFRYYFSNHLNSTSVITDDQGNVVSESDYYPYGGEISIVTGDSNHYKFTGKERDAESGLDNFGARYHASTMGRFLSPDWSAKIMPVPYAKLYNPESLNLYAYVLNNPLIHVDADGHIIDDSELKDNKQYQKWKAEYLSHDAAKAQWNALNDNKNITVHMGWDSKATQSVTGGYQWDKSGTLTGVNVTLGAKTGDVSYHMSADSGYIHGSTISDPALRQAYVIAHEFGHVEYAQTDTGRDSLQQSQKDAAFTAAKFKELGVQPALELPDVQAANQRLLDSGHEREMGADQRGWDVVKPQ